MNLPRYREAVALASSLMVLNQKTSAMEPFRLNREQERVLKAMLRSPRRRVVILKGRQIGCSTVIVYFLMLVAIMNPGLPIAIVAHKQDVANGLLGKVKGWLAQIGVGLSVANVESIVLENGASIDALSAVSPAEGGESTVGRSKSYGAIHATEQAFWRNAQAVWASVTSTKLAGAFLVAESTGTPGETLFRRTFDDAAKDGWDPLFFGVEDHENYRDDVQSISDETWEALRAEYGFTRRDAAAWWWNTLHGTMKGDVRRMLREYPVVPDHSWAFREGLHISKYREVPVIVTESGAWNYYDPATKRDDGTEGWNEPVILGVDTAEGIGLDSSAMALVGHRSGRVLATWKSNETPIPQYIQHVKAVHARFAPVATVVEKNGVGAVVYQACGGLYGVDKQTSGNRDGEVQVRRDMLRDAIESGEVPIGGHLVEEAKSSQVKPKVNADGVVRVAFVGMDDALSAVSFARKWRAENPYRTTTAELEDRTRFYVQRKLKAGRKNQTW